VPTDILVWHRRDLRVRDNAALAAAARDGRPHPLFVFNPHFYRSDLICDARIEFCHESLNSLDAAYRERGSRLAYAHGDPVSLLLDHLAAGTVDRIYYNADVTAGYARERDRQLRAVDDATAFEDDAIVRDADEPRAGWRDNLKDYFEREPHDAPTDLPDNRLPEDPTPAAIADRYDVDGEKADRPTGGCDRARERLESFVANIANYVGGISPPAEAERRTSHLSPYLRFGCLSVRQAHRHAREHAAGGRARSLFTERLAWNRHFTQKLQDNPALREVAINPVFRGMNRERHDEDREAAWKAGQTGFPLVDASMRALRETGWLNFRMRAMCASFFTYVLGCYWKRGADWFYRHLLDADPAINYAQWQMQSGLVGVHPLRVYDPRKQVRENDPEGAFVREYVPELRPFPTEYLDRPERAPEPVQQECGVLIGEDYPAPIVDFEARREAALDRWAELGDRAREALADPEVSRRASLSRSRDRAGGGVENGREPRPDEQRGLDDFA